MQDQLLAAAKQVANATAALVLQAKNVASTCDDQGQQNRVIGAATQGALATSQLVACAKVGPSYVIYWGIRLVLVAQVTCFLFRKGSPKCHMARL